MQFGLMFFSSGAAEGQPAYELLLSAARFADSHDFCCVWTPERHFHAFGGIFPNPAVTSAALAVTTDHIQLRAGSLVSPLHDPIRITEEWSAVDNLSAGRAAISFGSGWNIDDFVFFPDRYERRREIMIEQIETVRRLWRGQSVTVKNSAGRDVSLGVFPRPVQEELPIWLTSSGNPETFAQAGALGTNLLTHLIGQDLEGLAEKIGRYRAELAAHGHDPAAFRVSLMLHTFLSDDAASAVERVKEPFKHYLRSAISLEQMAAEAGGAISGGHRIDPEDIPEPVLAELLELTFERYQRTASLIGTPKSCRKLLDRCAAIGVDEIACLVDFVDDPGTILEGLEHLDKLRRSCLSGSEQTTREAELATFLEDLEG